MYLHLGKNTVVRHDNIIGIFDLDITSQSHLTRAYLNSAEKNKQVINISDDLPKSFVVCDTVEQLVYLSQLASSTRLRRSEGVFLD